MRITFSLFALVLSMSVSGCGYTFQGSGSILPADVKRVYIPTVENNSAETGLSGTVTEALRDRFDRFGVITVVDDLKDADAVLRAKIVKVARSARSVTSNTDIALQQDTTMTIAADLRRVTGPVLWRNPALKVSASFGADRDVVVTSSPEFSGGSIGASDLGNLNSREVQRGQEREALDRLAEQAAKLIYDDAVTPDF